MKHLSLLCVLSATTVTGCTVQPQPTYGGPRPVNQPYQPGPAAQPPPPPPQQPAYQEPPPAPMPPPPPVATGCADPAERDFSNLFDRATPIQPTSTTRGCVQRNDKDMFSVTAPTGGAGMIVTYSLTGDQIYAPRIVIFDQNRKRSFGKHAARGVPLKGWMIIAPGTTVYVEASELHSDDTMYTLALTAQPLTDPSEPNPDYQNATPITAATIQGYLASTANDKTAVDDWYQLDVTGRGTLSLTVDPSQDIATRVTVYDRNRKRLDAKSGGRGERIELIAKRAKPGPHFVLVNSVHNVPWAGEGELPENLTRPYTLTVTQ